MEWCTGRNTLVEFCRTTDCFIHYADNRSVNGSTVFRCGGISVYGRSIFGLAGVIYPRAFFLAYIADNVFIDDCVVFVRLETDYQPI